MRVFKGVIFDLDDTLYSLEKLLKLQWCSHRDVMEKLGVDPEKLHQVYLETEGKAAPKETLLATLKKLQLKTELASELEKVANDGVPEGLEAFEEVKTMLETLRSRGVRTAVITNGSLLRQQLKLEVLGIGDLFDLVMVCDGITNPFKPSTEPFETALEILELQAQEVCMVGDRFDNDLSPALGMGMGVVRVRHGKYSKIPNEAEVTFDAQTPQEVAKFLLEATDPGAYARAKGAVTL